MVMADSGVFAISARRRLEQTAFLHLHPPPTVRLERRISHFVISCELIRSQTPYGAVGK